MRIFHLILERYEGDTFGIILDKNGDNIYDYEAPFTGDCVDDDAGMAAAEPTLASCADAAVYHTTEAISRIRRGYSPLLLENIDIETVEVSKSQVEHVVGVGLAGSGPRHIAR